MVYFKIEIVHHYINPTNVSYYTTSRINLCKYITYSLKYAKQDTISAKMAPCFFCICYISSRRTCAIRTLSKVISHKDGAILDLKLMGAHFSCRMKLAWHDKAWLSVTSHDYKCSCLDMDCKSSKLCSGQSPDNSLECTAGLFDLINLNYRELFLGVIPFLCFVTGGQIYRSQFPIDCCRYSQATCI